MTGLLIIIELHFLRKIRRGNIEYCTKEITLKITQKKDILLNILQIFEVKFYQNTIMIPELSMILEFKDDEILELRGPKDSIKKFIHCINL